MARARLSWRLLSWARAACPCRTHCCREQASMSERARLRLYAQGSAGVLLPALRLGTARSMGARRRGVPQPQRECARVRGGRRRRGSGLVASQPPPHPRRLLLLLLIAADLRPYECSREAGGVRHASRCPLTATRPLASCSGVPSSSSTCTRRGAQRTHRCKR